jgi:carbon-monoxide dehydrogenase small subunit
VQTSLTVNGRPAEVDVESRVLLVDILRDELGLTGTKIGCDTGQCGTCLVDLDGRSVKSCTVLAVQAGGRAVTTIEGVGSADRLSALQEALWTHHGIQCGFCAAGMVVSLRDLLAHNTAPGEAEIRSWLNGVLCRCTGYHSVVRAVLDLVEAERVASVEPVPPEEQAGVPTRGALPTTVPAR